jgi:hypothetical protein
LIGRCAECETGNIAENNILYDCEGTTAAYGNFNNFAHDYNWFLGNANYSSGASMDSDWAGSESHSQLGVGSPFTDGTGYDFTLGGPTDAGDAAIGEAYDTDLLGNARGGDGVWDRGAYEYCVTCTSAEEPVEDAAEEPDADPAADIIVESEELAADAAQDGAPEETGGEGCGCSFVHVA